MYSAFRSLYHVGASLQLLATKTLFTAVFCLSTAELPKMTNYLSACWLVQVQADANSSFRIMSRAICRISSLASRQRLQDGYWQEMRWHQVTDSIAVDRATAAAVCTVLHGSRISHRSNLIQARLEPELEIRKKKCRYGWNLVPLPWISFHSAFVFLLYCLPFARFRHIKSSQIKSNKNKKLSYRRGSARCGCRSPQLKSIILVLTSVQLTWTKFTYALLILNCPMGVITRYFAQNNSFCSQLRQIHL